MVGEPAAMVRAPVAPVHHTCAIGPLADEWLAVPTRPYLRNLIGRLDVPPQRAEGAPAA